MQIVVEVGMFSVERINKARELAKAIQEEAMSGEIDSHILIWRLAAALEELAVAFASEEDSEMFESRTGNHPDLSGETAYRRCRSFPMITGELRHPVGLQRGVLPVSSPMH